LAFVGIENEASPVCRVAAGVRRVSTRSEGAGPERRDGGELRTLEGRKSREVRATAPEFISEFQHGRSIVAGQQQGIGHEGFQSLNRQASASKIVRWRLTIAMQHFRAGNARSYFHDAETYSNRMIL